MKKILFVFIAIFFASQSFAIEFSTVPKEPAKLDASAIMIPLNKQGDKISLLDLSTIRIKDYEKQSGKKLNLFQKVKFKMLQKQLKNSINNDGDIVVKNLKADTFKAKDDAQTRKYLRLWLILLGASLVLYLLSIVLWPLIYIGYLASLGAAVFFVLWLISMAGGV